MMMQFNHTSSGQILLLLWHVRKGQKLNWSFLELISPLISSSPSNISHLHAMWMFIMFIRWAVFSVHLYHILELRPLHVYWLRGYLRSWGKRKHYSWSGVVILPAPTQTLHNIKKTCTDTSFVFYVANGQKIHLFSFMRPSSPVSSISQSKKTRWTYFHPPQSTIILCCEVRPTRSDDHSVTVV